MKVSPKTLAVRIAVFGFCLLFCAGTFLILKDREDPLSRYPYGTEQQRAMLAKELDEEEIDILINSQILPDEVLPFAKSPGFDISRTLYYARALETQKADPDFIVYFVNHYRDRFDLNSLQSILSWMSYSDLVSYYESNSAIPLASSPLDEQLILTGQSTLWKWRPSDLKEIAPGITLRSQAAAAWQTMQQAAAAEGIELQAESAFVPYEQQPSVAQFSSYPLKAYGTWEEQLGLTVHVSGFTHWNTMISAMDPSKIDTESARLQLDDQEKDVMNWLQANAWKYGWTLRYPNGKEAMTGTVWQPFVLRYTGEETAQRLHEQGISLNEDQQKGSAS